MKDHYKTIIYGFCDTLPIIKKITGKKSKGSNKLENLTKELNISYDKAHDALHDVIMLEQVIKKLQISDVEFQRHSFT